MTRFLLLSVRFLDDRYHGRTDNNMRAEWPPSPFRVFQAIIAGNARGRQIPEELRDALCWLEQIDPPIIIAPDAREGRPLLTYVLNNVSDDPKKNLRTGKTIRPMLLNGDRLVQYAWEFDASTPKSLEHAQIIMEAARHIHSLGWGIDLAIGHGKIVEHISPVTGPRVQYSPTNARLVVGISLRVPIRGSLMTLERTYADFLQRSDEPGITRLESAAIYELQRYMVRDARPYVVFELRCDGGEFCRYSQRKLIHIAGMVRHLAIDAMKFAPPLNVPDNWVETYVRGKALPGVEQHSQFSYIPLPSIGHPHADQAIRRVMIAAPVGDDDLLEHLSRRLAGQQLKPEKGNEFGEQDPPTLVRVHRDKVVPYYTDPANTWSSVTPVILPGHDDHKPAKTVKLIEKALAQSGIDLPCTYKWSAFSQWPKSFSAHKYNRDKNPTGYIRPDHLLTQTAIHLTIRFENDLDVPGPLAIGAGRHCGFGLMARING